MIQQGDSVPTLKFVTFNKEAQLLKYFEQAIKNCSSNDSIHRGDPDPTCRTNLFVDIGPKGMRTKEFEIFHQVAVYGLPAVDASEIIDEAVNCINIKKMELVRIKDGKKILNYLPILISFTNKRDLLNLADKLAMSVPAVISILPEIISSEDAGRFLMVLFHDLLTYHESGINLYRSYSGAKSAGVLHSNPNAINLHSQLSEENLEKLYLR